MTGMVHPDKENDNFPVMLHTRVAYPDGNNICISSSIFCVCLPNNPVYHSFFEVCGPPFLWTARGHHVKIVVPPPQ